MQAEKQNRGELEQPAITPNPRGAVSCMRLKHKNPASPGRDAHRHTRHHFWLVVVAQGELDYSPSLGFPGQRQTLIQTQISWINSHGALDRLSHPRFDPVTLRCQVQLSLTTAKRKRPGRALPPQCGLPASSVSQQGQP